MKRFFNKILTVAVIGVGTVTVPTATAQAQTTTLTLDECRQRAVDRNVALRNADESVTAANEQQKETFTGYFPTVSASGLGYNANKGLIQMEMEPGQTMNLLKNGVMGSVTLTQPLFAGGQIVNGNKLARLGVEVSELQRDQARKEVLLTVEKYFWQVVTLMEKKKTLQAVDDMLSRVCDDVSLSVNAGLTTRNDLLQVQLRRNDVASSMINLDNSLMLSRRVLAQYIGMTGEDITVTNSVSMDTVPEFPYDLKANHATALLTTPEYQLLERNVEANKLQQKLAVGKNMPSVGVGAGYMYDNLTDKDHPFGIVFVSVSVPISGWWGGSHAIKRQKANVAMANNTLTDSSDLLVIQMQNLWNKVEDAYKQMQIAQSSIQQSTENLRLNRNYYRAGTSTMSDLLDAQSLYQQSRDKMVETYAQFRIQVLEYRQATGQDE
jgi:outer membrane protein TolC